MSASGVSVVIPTRDRPRLLADAVGSVLEQRGVELDVVVVDDAGETRAADALDGEPRVRVVRHPERRGVAAARNTGIEHAEGEWVAFLDDDDLWAPEKVRVQLDVAAARDAEFVYGTTVMFDETGGRAVRLPLAEDRDLVRGLHTACVVGPPSSVMVKAEPIRAAGGFDEGFTVLEDWEMWLRLAPSRAAACPEPVVGYRRHAGNVSALWADEILSHFERIRERHGPAARAHGVDFDEAGMRAWIAEEQLRGGNRLGAARAFLGGWRPGRDRRYLSYAARSLFGPRGMSLRGRADPSDDLPEWLASSL